MADAIDREQMDVKLQRMKNRIRQRRDGPYKVGYSDACNDAIQKLSECQRLKTATVTECKDCRNAIERDTTMPFCAIQNRRKEPEDFCKYGATDFD